ncbi:MAG: hypothetical protein FJY56_15875 [Betaproteobacteria bacterium]|nr:hypothetical protein [Betaproteobacteria bacterium]
MLSAPYATIKRLRCDGKTAAAYAELRSAPPRSDHDAFEAAVCLFVCGDAASAVNVCSTYAWKAPWARHLAQGLALMLRDGDAAQALAAARRGMAEPLTNPDAQAIFLMLLQANDLSAEADAYIQCHLREPPAGETFLLNVMAEVAAALYDWRQAYRLASAVLAANPDDFRALITLSTVNQNLKNTHEALGNALRAHLANPQAQQALLHMMRCQNALGDYLGALGSFDTIGEQQTPAPQLLTERGLAYAGLDLRGAALTAFTAAVATAPAPIEALRALLDLHANARDLQAIAALEQTHGAAIGADIECQSVLGIARLAQGELDAAAAHFENAYTLARHSGRPLAQLPWPLPEPLLRHDCEQLQLLEKRGKLDAAGREALGVLRRHLAGSTGIEQRFAPAGAEATRLQRAMTDLHYRPETRFSGRALGDNDFHDIENRYLAATPPVVVIDNLLSRDALAALRQYCEEATIWRLHYPRGYVGATLPYGFANGALLALTHELKQAMPRVISDHALLQAWAFKYDQRMQGIHLHADFAKVNINFWITPDAACADPTCGGLVLYDVPAPASWTFADYNSNQAKMTAFLKVSNAQSVRVPYRENRCVLFDSSLIHVTDQIHFKPGYENRRVNVTLLYGRARTQG